MKFFEFCTDRLRLLDRFAVRSASPVRSLSLLDVGVYGYNFLNEVGGIV